MTRQAIRPRVERQDLKRPHKESGRGVKMRPIMKWAERWIRAVLGGCGGAGGGGWGESMERPGLLPAKNSNSELVWCVTAVISKPQTSQRCLPGRPSHLEVSVETHSQLHYVRKKCSSRTISAATSRTRVNASQNGDSPNAPKVLWNLQASHTHSGKQNPWEAISDSASHSGYKGLRLSSVLTSTAVCTLPVDPPKLFHWPSPPPSLSLQNSQNGKGKNAATAPASSWPRGSSLGRNMACSGPSKGQRSRLKLIYFIIW